MDSVNPDERFGEFWELLNKQVDGFQPSMRKIFWTCFRQVYSQMVTPQKSPKKNISSWNHFMAFEMANVKEDKSIPPNRRLRVIADRWHALGNDGQNEWCDQHGYQRPKSHNKKSTIKKSRSSDEEDATTESDVESAPAQTVEDKKKSQSSDEESAPAQTVEDKKKSHSSDEESAPAQMVEDKKKSQSSDEQSVPVQKKSPATKKQPPQRKKGNVPQKTTKSDAIVVESAAPKPDGGEKIDPAPIPNGTNKADVSVTDVKKL